ncbi:energy-coupling factor transporter ATPase [Staphylococcus carnosus]|uniref:energy-coupling factor transporter ATPase n=1 Tax=Staphylococcus carnosus TaxID=1281 RepID=UPI003531217B
MLNNEHIIEFDNVSFQYQGDEWFTLNDISFKIPKGKWTSIVGHNGSGKSTIAKLMMGMMQYQEGRILFEDQRVTAHNLTEIRKHIGIVFQNPENQFVGSTVQYDVAFGLENFMVPYEKMHEEVPEVLKEVDMYAQRNHEPQALSGGQKQRVAIAGVLVLSPEVIILDEATSMLDPEGKATLMRLVRHLNEDKNVTIISITHDLTETVDSDYMIVLNRGKVYEMGTPKEIFEKGSSLTEIGLDLPFPMKINQMLGNPPEFLNYDELVDRL